VAKIMSALVGAKMSGVPMGGTGNRQQDRQRIISQIEENKRNPKRVRKYATQEGGPNASSFGSLLMGGGASSFGKFR